ncbi:MAG TPA: class I SAM-dependent methyltransferase [Bacteroidales bacterium]|nr:class I SAM-dependent methyltransferase [Bacteroidales bacterium]
MNIEKLKKDDYIHGGTQKDFYDETQREFCRCPLCNADEYSVLGSERGLSVVKCNSCKLIYTNPRANNAQENYFGDADTFYNEARLIFKGKKVHHRDRNYEYEVKKIKKYKNSGKLLDVGTNMGFFLRKAREAGFETEGVEPSPALSKIATENWGLKIHNSFLEQASLPENNYDVITLIDVFEHVTNPKELLKKNYSLLKSDGIMAIKVPNGDYNYFKMKLGTLTGKGKKMDIWDCYEHVVHYTPATFRKMAESCGYKIKKCFIPLPIHSPVWANLVGHYYQYPSPVILDWKRILLRNVFYHLGKNELALRGKTRFGLDLMFIIEKIK